MKKIIVIEGAPGSGKTTLIKGVSQYLTNVGRPHRVYPDRMDWMHGNGSAQINRYTLDNIYNKQWYAIMSILRDNDSIVCSIYDTIILDRWYYSMELFADYELRAVTEEALILMETIQKIKKLLIEPDVWIRLKGTQTHRRLNMRQELARAPIYQPNFTEDIERLYDGYKFHHVLDGDLSTEELVNKVVKILDNCEV